MPRGVSIFDEAAIQGRFWRPRSVFGSRVLIDLDAREGLSGSGSNLTWSDRASGVTATGTGGVGPVALAGRPAATFNANQFIVAPLPYDLSASGLICIVVGALNATTNYGRAAALYTTGSGGDYDNPNAAALLDADSGSANVRAERNGTSIPNQAVTLGRPFVATTIMPATGAYSLALNDGVPATGSTTASTFSFTNLTIGAGRAINGTASFYWNGPIARVLIVAGARFSPREVSLLTAEAAWGANVQRYLTPGRSPFLNRPPLIGD
jgi:hypothetical protein